MRINVEHGAQRWTVARPRSGSPSSERWHLNLEHVLGHTVPGHYRRLLTLPTKKWPFTRWGYRLIRMTKAA